MAALVTSILPCCKQSVDAPALAAACPRGYNIGTRLIDEYLAKARLGRCANFREAAELVGRSALPMFLNVVGNVTNWNAEGTECSLVRMGGSP
jgi:hypothetical protein